MTITSIRKISGIIVLYSTAIIYLLFLGLASVVLIKEYPIVLFINLALCLIFMPVIWLIFIWNKRKTIKKMIAALNIMVCITPLYSIFQENFDVLPLGIAIFSILSSVTIIFIFSVKLIK